MFTNSSVNIRQVLLWALVVGLPLLLLRLYMDREPPAEAEDPEQVMVDNISAIHEAMVRFTRDQGYSPLDFNELMAKGYMQKLIDEKVIAKFPENPYTHKAIRQIPWGQPPQSGDFAYLPAVEYQGDQPSSTGIHLIAYGEKRAHFLSLYIDSDSDGNADPIYMVISKNSGAVKGARLEPLEETLARMGYTRPLESAFP
jgi:hypothetical protein